MDNLYQLGAIAVFREFMEQRCCPDGGSNQGYSQFPGQQQQSPAAAAFQHGTGSLTSYADCLMQSMQPSTVQEVLSWDVGSWCNFFKQTSAEISILLQVSARNAAGAAQEQLQQELQVQHDDQGAAGVQQRLSQVCFKTYTQTFRRAHLQIERLCVLMNTVGVDRFAPYSTFVPSSTSAQQYKLNPGLQAHVACPQGIPHCCVPHIKMHTPATLLTDTRLHILLPGCLPVVSPAAQVVDRLAATGLVGSMFGDKVGQQLGSCTSTNHITMCQESPPPDHWRRVLLRLRPSYAQLLQLAAGFQEFVRMRKASQAVQLSLTAQVECSRSCNSQTLVAASMRQGGSVSTSATTAAAAAAAGSGRSHSHGSGCSGPPCPGGAGAATAADSSSDTKSSATVPAATAPACSSLMDQLLRTLNHAFVMVQALMLNTLTRRQIAQLVVSSFPYVPRPAPLMEAAHELLTQRQRQQQ